MKAAIYCRVSTDNQEREGTSLQTQLENCLNYCRNKGYDVSYRFSEAYSGLSLERLELNKLRELVRTEAIDVVICYSLDRLTRDPGHGVIITQELEKHCVTLEAVTETIDSSELGKLISYIRGFASKLEAEKIRERTMRGKRARAAAGRLPSGTGHKLYGYDYVKGKHVGEGVRYINATEAEWVRRMFTWLVDEGLSVNGITRRLRALGVPTPAGGKYWIRQTVYRMLANPAYIGKTYAFTKQYVEPRTRRKVGAKRKNTGVIARPKEQWTEIPNATPPMVDVGLFESAQTVLRRNKELSCRNRKRDYLLSGYVFCQHCGSRFQGYVKKWAKPKPYEIRYYRCGKSQSIASPERCHNRQLPADRIENEVWARIETLLSTPELVLGELERMTGEQKENSTQIGTWQNQLATIGNRLKNMERQKDRIWKAFEITGDEEKFRHDIARYNKDKEALEKQDAEISQNIDIFNKHQIDIQSIKHACELVQSGLKNLEYQDKRLALAMLNIRVKVEGDLVTIEGNIPVLNDAIVNPLTRLPRPRWRKSPL